MRDALIRLLGSMKVWTLLLGIVLTPSAALLAKHGFNVSDDTVKMIAELMSLGFSVLLVGQGLTDHGKTAAQVNASVTTTTTVVPSDPPVVVEEKKQETP